MKTLPKSPAPLSQEREFTLLWEAVRTLERKIARLEATEILPTQHAYIGSES